MDNVGANEGSKQLDSPRVTDLTSFASVRIIPSLPPHSKHTTRHFRPTTPCSITTTCTHRPDFELHAGGGGGGDGGGGGRGGGGGSSGGDAPEFAPLHKTQKHRSGWIRACERDLALGERLEGGNAIKAVAYKLTLGLSRDTFRRDGARGLTRK